MILTQKAMPRRTFLRGMGAAVGLPLLDSMVPAWSAQAAAVADGGGRAVDAAPVRAREERVRAAFGAFWRDEGGREAPREWRYRRQAT